MTIAREGYSIIRCIKMTSSTASTSSLDDDFDNLDEFSQEDQVPKEGVYLKILNQPCKYFRFRYASEMVGTHGFIISNLKHTTKTKIYPTVQLCNYSGTAIIKCSLAQWDSDDLHVHTCCAQGLDVEVTVGPNVGYTVVFQNLSVIQPRKSEVHERLRKNVINFQGLSKKVLQDLAAKIELNKVRLKFSAHVSKDDDTPICPPVFSTVINSQKHASTKSLKICRMSRSTGSALGGDEIFLLVEKVVKDKVGVRMLQLNDKRQIIWREDCMFNENDDVHFQYAIVVRTPPYKNINIEKPVKVHIELYRKNTTERSKRRRFTYHPDIPSNSYQSIVKNETFPLEPPQVPIRYTETSNTSNTNSESLLTNIHENYDVAFAEDYNKPLRIETCDSDIDTEEFRDFAANFGVLKDYNYPGLDIAGDIMEIDFGPRLLSDGIVKEPKSSGSLKIPVKIEKVTDEENIDSFEDPEYDTRNVPGLKLVADEKFGDTTELTAVVKCETDIDIDEASLDSFVKSDKRPEMYEPYNPSTSKQIDVTTRSQSVANYTRNVLPQKTKESDNESTETEFKDHQFRLIDTRLLDIISKDDYALLEDLRDDGLSPSVCDNKGNNVIHCAVNSKSCLPVLLKLYQGMISEVINERNYDGKTPLHLAALQNSPMKVNLLLSHSAKHDVVDDDGDTALHLACQKGHLEVVETLLEAVPEMDVDQVNGKGQTALQIVCAAEDSPDNRAIIELLLEKGANVLATVIGNLSALQLTRDKPKMMQILQTYLPS